MSTRIALLGAESTGKSTLAQDLGGALRERGHRVAVVGEYLREFCDRHGRTPQVHEQAGIAQEQARRIDAAALGHGVVVADTTDLMVAIYSALLFQDHTLLQPALQGLQRFDAILLTALDLPWVPDRHLRDGPHVREPVDNALRAALIGHRLAFSVIHGQGPARLQAALAVVQPRLGSAAAAPGTRSAGQGRFTRLLDAAAGPGDPAPAWHCDCCDVPEYERLTLRARGR